MTNGRRAPPRNREERERKMKSHLTGHARPRRDRETRESPTTGSESAQRMLPPLHK